jgi:hypothetical protein
MMRRRRGGLELWQVPTPEGGATGIPGHGGRCVVILPGWPPSEGWVLFPKQLACMGSS